MATTRITEKISTLVSSQLPEFVRSDFTTYVSFVEAYYRFLEQDQGALEIVQNARSYSDIDTTTESFVNYFLANYAQNIPLGVLTNKRLLIKRIRDLYESKGSEISFKLLFQLLYNEPVEVTYPYDNVLRASDGVWIQKTTIRVSVLTGSVSDIIDRFLDMEKDGLFYHTSIIEVRLLTTNLYEFSLEHNELGPYEIGDIVTVSNGTSIIFSGAVSGTTTGYSIIAAGIGFKVAQIFNVNVGGAVDTQLQVLAVDGAGGITKLRILSFGYNFTEDVNVNLSAAGPVSLTSSVRKSSTLGFVESFTILSEYGASAPTRYFDADYNSDSPFNYTGNIILSTTVTTTAAQSESSGIADASLAIIRLTVGAIGRQPGSWASNKGFLSDDVIRLQAERLYQPFAYQVESALELSYFYEVVNKLVHPAGQKLFNSRVLTNTINATANVSVVTSSNIFTELRDALKITDTISVSFVPFISFANSVIILEASALNVNKELSDSVTMLESSTLLNTTKTLTDSVTMLEAINLSTNATDALTILESAAFSTNKPLSDSATMLESIAILADFNPAFTDSTTVTESLSITLLTTYNQSLADTFAIIESLSAIRLNYDSEAYFSEIYAGEGVI